MAWGLGHFALGERRTGERLLIGEGLLLFALVLLTPELIDGTAYLIPFLLGIAFIGLWGAQAVAAYHAARGRQAATRSPSPHSPAAAIAWLSIPLLAWGTIFWLAAANSASPAAVLDRFMGRWDRIAAESDAASTLTDDPAGLSRDASTAIDTLRGLCRAEVVPGDCEGPLRALGRDLQFRVVESGDGQATAVLEVVRYERRPSRFLGVFEGAEIVTVPYEPLLRLRLAAVPESGIAGVFGARRWQIVGSDAVPSSVEALGPRRWHES